MINKLELIIFLASIIMFSTLIFNLNRKSKKNNGNKLYKAFIALSAVFIIYLIGLIGQIIYMNNGGSETYAIYFEYVVYIGAMYQPILFFVISKLFEDNNANLKKYNWLYVFATILLLVLWTNDIHHLFYKTYSIYFSQTEFGPALTLYSIWAYTLYLITVAKIVRSSVKKSGTFTLQSLLIILGILIPLCGNLIGILRIANTTIYLQAILFAITIILYYIAILKLKALNVVPITNKTILDSMTDAYVVLSMDGTIVDLNKTCIEKFAPLMELRQNDNLYEKLKGKKTLKLEELKADIKGALDKKTTVTKEYHLQKNEYDKYFDVDIQPIKAKSGNEYVAILLLIRDITQTKKDIEILTKNENLVILGELAGGVAHDINTPISAIKSGVTMLKETSKSEDEIMLLTSMDRCADKIIALVNSLRNQIRNIGSDTVSEINLTSMLSDIKLILNNELKKNNVTLEIDIEKDINLNGNPTKLSQVITNIITNAIQAYDNKGGKVDVTVKEKNNEAYIYIKDYASGIPEKVRPYIFKNILTTKGVSGTGFGLYLAFSVIKGAFHGDITFETKTGEGTMFIISVPIK